MHCMLMDLLHGFEVLSTTEETLFNSRNVSRLVQNKVFFIFQATYFQLRTFVVVKYMHHGDDLVEHRTREASFGAQCTNHSANSMCE